MRWGTFESDAEAGCDRRRTPPNRSKKRAAIHHGRTSPDAIAQCRGGIIMPPRGRRRRRGDASMAPSSWSGLATARCSKTSSPYSSTIVRAGWPPSRRRWSWSDATLIEETAHVLKGAAGNLSATRLFDAAQTLERIGATGPTRRRGSGLAAAGDRGDAGHEQAPPVRARGRRWLNRRTVAPHSRPGWKPKSRSHHGAGGVQE